MNNSLPLACRRKTSTVAGGVALANALLMTALPTSSLAQDQAILEEVIVTASKRQQALSDVPNSVTAFTGEFLENTGAFSLIDYANTLPGVQFASQGTPGTSTLTMRGIATGSEPTPTVAIYLDEAPLSSNSANSVGGGLSADLGTVDLERVEVLRGPQGTLYGASALGGLFKYVTRKPNTDGIEGRIEAQYQDLDNGSDGYNVNGMINLPLGDSVALRASGYSKDLPGWVDNIGTDVEDSNEGEQTGARVALAWDATDHLRFTLSGMFQDIDMDGRAQVDYDPQTQQPLYGDYVALTRIPQPFEQDFTMYSGVIEWDLGFANLTSASSYSNFDSLRITDNFASYGFTLGLLPVPSDTTVRFDVLVDTEKFDQEIRLNSTNDGVLNWMAGVYYTDQETDSTQGLDFWADSMGGSLGGLLGPLADITLASSYKEYSAFGELYFDITDTIELSGGLRWASNDQNYHQSASGIAINPIAPFSPVVATGNSDEDVTTWMTSLKWDIGDDSMVYGRVATGYRAGGPNPVLLVADIPSTFDSDETINYEIGYRGSWLAGSLQTNATLFMIDWEDIQITQVAGGAGFRGNGGDAESRGAELELIWAPVTGLRVGANATYTKAELTEDTGTIVGGLDGDALPLTPELAASAFADYRFALTDSMDGFIGLNYNYVDDRDSALDSGLTPTFNENYLMGSYSLLDLRVGVSFDALQLTIWGKNVTDEQAELNATVSNGGSPFAPANLAQVVVAQPRTLGVTVSYDF